MYLMQNEWQMQKYIFAWDGDTLLGMFRYSKKRKSPHRRWRSRIWGMNPDVEFHIGERRRHVATKVLLS